MTTERRGDTLRRDTRPSPWRRAGFSVVGWRSPGWAAGWRARTAFVLFALHALLLFFPPLPPFWKGSLWSYLLGYGAASFALAEIHRRADHIRSGWAARGSRTRIAWIAGLILLALAGGSVLAHLDLETFHRFQREEGIWEPLTIVAYAGTALVLLDAGSGRPGRDLARHRRFLGALFVWAALEELDYFGLFGFVVGRVEGVYVGSLHDVVNLAAEGVLGPPGAALLLGAGVAAGILAWHAGWVRPRPLLRAVAFRGGWILTGVALLVLGAALDATLLDGVSVGINPEEIVELCGALCLAAFGLGEAVGRPAEGRSRP